MRFQAGRVRKGPEENNELPTAWSRERRAVCWRGGPGLGKGFGFSVLQGLDLPVVGGIFPIASRRTKNADTKITWSRRLRVQSVHTDEANRSEFFIRVMEVSESPSDICEKGLRSVQVSKKWNLEFPPINTVVSPWLRRRNTPDGRSSRRVFSNLRRK
jgi:hypothetical protein